MLSQFFIIVYITLRPEKVNIIFFIHKYIRSLIGNAYYLSEKFFEKKCLQMHIKKVENGIFPILLSRDKLLSV